MSALWAIFDSFNRISEEAKRAHLETVCNGLSASVHHAFKRWPSMQCSDMANLLKVRSRCKDERPLREEWK